MMQRFVYAHKGAGIIPICKKDNKTHILLQNITGKWEDFGGKKEGNETSIETAWREFSEESNISVDLLRIFKNVVAYPGFDWNDSRTHKMQFRCIENTNSYISYFVIFEYFEEKEKQKWFQINEIKDLKNLHSRLLVSGFLKKIDEMDIAS
jgi:8-oxo-dGTP pyrophosphatase MutT (NUDIX family)